MQGNYIVKGNTVLVLAEGALNMKDELPLNTYLLKFNTMTGELYLEQCSDMEVNKKVYGRMPDYVDRIFNTFQTRSGNTGILLSGEKGSGKTFLVKNLSKKMKGAGYSTIIVNERFDPTQMSKFFQNIVEPVLIIFDEFEKIYSDSDDDDDICVNGSSPKSQSGLLSLLDGVFTTRKLFAFTCNNLYKISDMLKNRPGRIFYHIKFAGLEEQAIKEYCDENLNNKEFLPQIIGISKLISNFTFDMLQAIVEESNRYNEKPIECLKLLNIEPSSNYYNRYSASWKSLEGKRIYPMQEYNELRCNILDGDDCTLYYKTSQKGEEQRIRLTSRILKSYNDDEMVFDNGKVEVTLTKNANDTNPWKYLDF